MLLPCEWVERLGVSAALSHSWSAARCTQHIEVCISCAVWEIWGNAGAGSTGKGGQMIQQHGSRLARGWHNSIRSLQLKDMHEDQS